MPPFVCTRCGRCCMHFGELIRIEREVSDIEFYCRFQVTNEVFRARVMPEFREAFADTAEVDANPAWCRFLRRMPDGKGFACTVHDTNASICREYRCCFMRIYDGTGKQVGKIGGNRSLITEDEDLRQFWNREVADLTATTLQGWLVRAGKALQDGGYRVVVYDEG